MAAEYYRALPKTGRRELKRGPHHSSLLTSLVQKRERVRAGAVQGAQRRYRFTILRNRSSWIASRQNPPRSGFVARKSRKSNVSTTARSRSAKAMIEASTIPKPKPGYFRSYSTARSNSPRSIGTRTKIALTNASRKDRAASPDMRARTIWSTSTITVSGTSASSARPDGSTPWRDRVTQPNGRSRKSVVRSRGRPSIAPLRNDFSQDLLGPLTEVGRPALTGTEERVRIFPAAKCFLYEMRHCSRERAALLACQLLYLLGQPSRDRDSSARNVHTYRYEYHGGLRCKQVRQHRAKRPEPVAQARPRRTSRS
jgi:hypothetical protein